MLKILENNVELKDILEKLRYRGATLKRKTNEVCFKFVSKEDLSEAEKQAVGKVLDTYAFGGYKFFAHFEKEKVDSLLIKQEFDAFLKKEFYSAYVKYKENGSSISRKENGVYVIGIVADKKSNEIFGDMNFKERVENYFSEYSFERVVVAIQITEGEFDFEATVSEIEKKQVMLRLDVLSRPDRSVAIKKIKTMTSTEVYGRPQRISDIDKTGIKVVVCGEITQLNIKDFRNTGKNFDFLVSGVIKDFTGTIGFAHFIRGKNLCYWDNLSVGNEIVIYGKVTEDSKGMTTIYVSAAAVCEIIKEKGNGIKIKPRENYLLIVPTPSQIAVQQDMFSYKEVTTSECLKGVTLTVFDFETTGLRPNEDRVVELGAVRIVDGVIVDEFQTLINPEMPIPKEASEINNIYDEDLVDCPKFAHIVGDFYKYSYGSVLVGHNVAFDSAFLDNEAKKVGYVFENKKLDTIEIAKMFFNSKNRGNIQSPNDYRLKTLARVFGIEFLEQHRALGDARVTAELLLKIAEINPEIIKNCLKTLA